MGSRGFADAIKVFDLSPATIRNVMSDLEELGLIHSPTPRPGACRRRAAIACSSIPCWRCSRTSWNRATWARCCRRPSPRAVNAAAALLSNLTQFAGVVLTPKRAQIFRQIEFIRLSDKRVLLIIVTPDGDVQNRILFVQRDYAESELLEAGNFFNVHFAGKSFDAVRPRCPPNSPSCARTSRA